MRSVLFTRIETLISHLDEVQDADRWWTVHGFVDQLSIELWRNVLGSLHADAVDCMVELGKARDGLADGSLSERDGWAIYEDVLPRSNAVFRECLELLGGLALRARTGDDRIAVIYHLSDALIGECSRNLATMFTSFAVPALEEAAVRRVARVPFPDWTLWTLPLVAYEYAFVALDIEKSLNKELKKIADPLASSLAVTDGPEPSRHGIRLRVRMLLAEALATYTLGPAYACAALLLRRQPFDNATPSRPSDLERARMILAVLGHRDRTLPGSVFKQVHDVLTDRWTSAVQGAVSGSDSLDLSPPMPLQEILQAFERTLVGGDKSFSANSWNNARNCAQQLLHHASTGTGSAVASDSFQCLTQLRDVLNAVWWARLAFDLPAGRSVGLDAPDGDLLDLLERTGTEACTQIATLTSRLGSPPIPRQSDELK